MKYDFSHFGPLFFEMYLLERKRKANNQGQTQFSFSNLKSVWFLELTMPSDVLCRMEDWNNPKKSKSDHNDSVVIKVFKYDSFYLIFRNRKELSWF
jgi:hypothetical protein